MPNWCSNDITLYHDDVAKIDALEAQLKKVDANESEDVLNFLLPNPSDEWDYGWSVDNWGTKWDIRVFNWDRDGNTIQISADSAWGPPTTAYETLCEQGWEVDAMYEEPGMAFVGHWDNGSEFHYDYDFEDPNWADEIPDDLIEYAGLDTAYEDWKEWQEDLDEIEDEEEMD